MNTTPKPFVFTLMPFDQDFDDVYELGIRPACEGAGAYCERVDEQIFEESILQRIYNQIGKADLIVADLTGRNPNVFYETGYAHALGRPVILLTASAADIPFDLKHYPHVIYGNRIADLKEQLKRRVEWHLSQRGLSALQTSVEQLEFYVDQTKAENGGVITVPADDPRRDNQTFLIRFSVGLHNASSRIYRGEDQVGFLCPKAVGLTDLSDGGVPGDPPILLPDNRNLIVFRELPHFLPGSWEVVRLSSYVPDGALRSGVPFTIRLFTPTGPRDLDLTLVPDFTDRLDEVE